MKVFYARFGSAVVARRLDLDEATLHLSICMLPIYEKTTKRTTSTTVSYRKVLGGETREAARSNLIGWQD
jgi:hypothetical protein